MIKHYTNYLLLITSSVVFSWAMLALGCYMFIQVVLDSLYSVYVLMCIGLFMLAMHVLLAYKLLNINKERLPMLARAGALLVAHLCGFVLIGGLTYLTVIS